jgi:hypothetical protein
LNSADAAMYAVKYTKRLAKKNLARK